MHIESRKRTTFSLYEFFVDVDERERREESFGALESMTKKEYNDPRKKSTANYHKINAMTCKNVNKVKYSPAATMT